MFGKKEEPVEVKEEDKKPQEDWMTKKWRPMMAMMYMTCCLMDFAIFPIMFTIVQFWETQAANDAFRQWVPITLQGGGLFHVAMGAVLGVSAYGRTQEKVAGASNVSTGFQGGGVPTPSLSSAVPSIPGGGFSSPQPTPPSSFGNQGFGAQTPSFGSSQSFNTASTQTVTEFSMTPVQSSTSTPGGRRPVTPNFDV
jgi:hypothetical protein